MMASTTKELNQVPCPPLKNITIIENDVILAEPPDFEFVDVNNLVKIEQPPLPSREEINNEIALENERRSMLNRQNAPPASFTRAPKKKTKVMRIVPRKTELVI